MRTIAIIPARMGSGRFPGKPMQDICGLSMIGHCSLRTRLCRGLDRVVVATPDQNIADHIASLGGDIVVTPEFDMCNDRIAWAYDKILETDAPYDLVINVQGDQPLVFPEMLDAVITSAAALPEVPSFTMVEPCNTLEDFYDLNRVKVLFRAQDNMLIYMSRAPIPSPKKKDVLPASCWKHVAIIAFRPEFLKEFLAFGMTYNEEVEGIDYNRVIEMGREMHVSASQIITDTVDTPEDLARVNLTMRSDPLWAARAYYRS